MGVNSIRQAIESRFYTNWSSTDKTSTVRFSNRPFQPPSQKIWLSIDVKLHNSKNSGISGKSRMRRGHIFCEVRSPVDSGTGDLAVVTDDFIEIFENQQFEGIQCLAADIRHIGVPNIQGTDPQWYVYRVSIPFYRYE